MEEQSAAGICVSASMSLPKVARKGSKPATTERFQLPGNGRFRVYTANNIELVHI